MEAEPGFYNALASTVMMLHDERSTVLRVMALSLLDNSRVL